MEITKARKLWILFSTTFMISASTNGGFAIVSVMRSTFVNKYHWISEDEMLDLISIAQSSPGPIAINGSTLLGYRVAGFTGAVACMLGTALPPLLIMTLVTYFYNAFATNVYIRYFMRGMQGAVAALLVDVTIGLFLAVSKSHNWLSYVLMIVAFVTVQFTHVNMFLLALFCALCGIVKIYLIKGKESY